MSSQRRFPPALAAIALTLVAVAGGSHFGAVAAGQDGPGHPLLDPGFVAVGAQPVGLEASRTARRADSVNRHRPPGGAMSLVAVAAVWALVHLWCLLKPGGRAKRTRAPMGWTLAPRAPPLPRLL